MPVPGENRLIWFAGGSHDAPWDLAASELSSGRLLWSYPNPYHSVHGSHRATMPKPGLLIGSLKTCGVAHVDDRVGNVFLIRGNLGQDFLLTSDGLFVGAMFQDGRLPGESLPDSEQLLCGMPLEGLSEGGEPFNGWFGKQADGRIPAYDGHGREAAMILQVNGLETIRRFNAGPVTVAMSAILQADRDNTRRAKPAAQSKQYTVARLGKPVALDGNAAAWKDVAPLSISREGQPERATVKLAYDDMNLYLSFDVQDLTPWRNEGRDFARLFKTGDAVDLQLSCISAGEAPSRAGRRRRSRAYRSLAGKARGGPDGAGRSEGSRRGEQGLYVAGGRQAL